MHEAITGSIDSSPRHGIRSLSKRLDEVRDELVERSRAQEEGNKANKIRANSTKKRSALTIQKEG